MGVYSVLKKVVKFLRKKEILPVVQTVFSEKLLEKKTVLITDGTGGIGFSIATALVKCGGRVILSGTSEKRLDKYQKILNGIKQGSCVCLKMNMADVSSFDSCIEKAASMFGSFDVLVHCAGVHTENVDFWSMNATEFDRVLEINLKAAYFMCQSIGTYFRKNKIKGKIILISSSRGSEPAWSPYGISKWGMNGMVKGLAKLFLQYGITVNAIAPGSTATPMLGYEEGGSIYSEENGAGRLVMPEEVANVVQLLASTAGNMMSGEVIHISAGRGVFDVR